MGVTPAPVNAWFLAWIALTPLWILLVGRSTFNAEREPPTFALFSFDCFLGFIWGVGYHGLALSWIRDLHPLMWLGVPWLASVAITFFAWAFITFWGASFVTLWVWLFRLFCYSPKFVKSRLPVWLRVLIGTALWCGLQALWNYGPLDWTTLSFTQSPGNLLILHLGRISGPVMVTGAIVAFNGLLAEAWLQFNIEKARLKARHILTFSLTFLLGLHLVGFGLYNQSLKESPDTALNIGIIQGNIPTRTKHSDEGIQRAFRHYVQGYRTLASQGVDAVLTSEGAFPWVWLETPQRDRHPFYQEVLQQQVPVWLGTPGVKPSGIAQTLFTLNGTGEILSRYDKIKLVPLGEYIPFQSVLGKVINRLSPVSASMVPGDSNQQVDTPFGRAIVGICFDSAFPWIFRSQAAAGGAFILTASNNDPYNTSMMAQHHAQDVMRTIETDRWAARATNTGYSAIVDPHGKTHWISDNNTYELHADTIYRRQTQTLYVRWGDWFTPVLLGVAFVSWGIARKEGRSRPLNY
ncbi:MAG: apolipoprotein N-acyltransferase [Elainellaceae cyanobacterium]